MATKLKELVKEKQRVKNEWLKITCQICGKQFQHLGSHVWHCHKMTAREYKEEFGLDYKFSLISPAVKEKKREKFEEHREKYIKNLKKAGKKWWFKKGISNRTRFSKQSKERLRKNSEWVNEENSGKCPICKMHFDHLPSHLYNKHGLQFAKK